MGTILLMNLYLLEHQTLTASYDLRGRLQQGKQDTQFTFKKSLSKNTNNEICWLTSTDTKKNKVLASARLIY